MTLGVEELKWVRANLHADAGEQDLAETYRFVHPLNATTGVTCLLVSEQALRWRVEMYDDDGRATLVTRDGRPGGMIRYVDLDHPLRMAERGAVASHEGFRVRDDAPRPRGLAKAIQPREEALYRQWSVCEVHLDAEDDGLVVWPKLGFEPYSMGMILERYEEWVSTRDGMPPPPERLKDYPEDFLRSLQYVHMYKVLQ